MPSVRGCNLPDELLYDVDNHIWFTEMGDGTVKIGMTAVATAMAGKLVSGVAFVRASPAAHSNPANGWGRPSRRQVEKSLVSTMTW